ncbi:hypothetical protein PHSY_000853 [Pseudozyma hubeiensis SY62]|uniref:Uncharacterized protein n=1 Tax=Pseudozyma hubeiensis (strain SY62) TaxID=1305764 RepID=R9NXF4_PSEHS|nr:hypothetical protein PHSY_000853 [Pseudozyma hubeiensis SY62]GAC93289.1 hypothetical protein PHSY_000853 [Pseudozyma hubeiensis SY62]
MSGRAESALPTRTRVRSSDFCADECAFLQPAVEEPRGSIGDGTSVAMCSSFVLTTTFRCQDDDENVAGGGRKGSVSALTQIPSRITVSNPYLLKFDRRLGLFRLMVASERERLSRIGECPIGRTQYTGDFVPNTVPPTCQRLQAAGREGNDVCKAEKPTGISQGRPDRRWRPIEQIPLPPHWTGMLLT